jgi:hypothetical protein
MLCGMSEPLNEKLERLMSERGMSARALSRAAGLNDTAIRDLLTRGTVGAESAHRRCQWSDPPPAAEKPTRPIEERYRDARSRAGA